MTEVEFEAWLVECPEERWRVESNLPSGQIVRGSPFGDAIYDIAKMEQYLNYLEIGTWCGRGTTKCFLDGIIPREDGANLCALETNDKFYKITENYWSKYFQYKKIDPEKLNLIFGSVVTYDQLDHSYVTDSGFTKETYDYNIDLKKAPFINIENIVDVLCLDGGHFATILEWEMFKDQIKVIILDDTTTSKTRKIVEEIKNSGNWNITYHTNNRNGELIAYKI
jgi:hypothetical protein